MNLLTLLDEALVIYILTSLVSFYVFVLFVWEWQRKGTASWIFADICFLAIAIGFRNAVDAYACHLRLFHDYHVLSEFQNTDLWAYRALPIFLAMSFIAVHVTMRIARSRRGR
jgi:hypothetical protein